MRQFYYPISVDPDFAEKSVMGRRALLLSASALLGALTGCSAQNTGFATNVGGLCSGATCSTTPLVNNNPNIFISSQAASIPKPVSFLPAIPLTNTGCAGAVRSRRTDYTGCPGVAPTAQVAATYTVFKQRAEISGTCGTGGAAAHKITYSIRDVNSVTIGADIYGATYGDALSAQLYSKPTWCDNGRFTIMITPPLDTTVTNAVTGTCPNYLVQYCAVKPLYYLTVYLWTGADVNSMTVATSFETSFSTQF